MGEWFTTTIGEQATLQRGFDITRAQQRPGVIPVVSSGGISSLHDEWMVSGPGVVLGRKGIVGSVYFVPNNFWPHDTTLWVKDFHNNNERFVYYFFKWLAPRLAILDVGSANPTLNRNHVHPIRVIWPKYEIQKQISTLLAALDDKIELNRQTNATLEAMARALFKDWFVDFGPTRAKADGRAPYLAPHLWELFPDALDDEDKPAGWSSFLVKDIAEQFKNTLSPSSEPETLFEHYSIPAFDSGKEPALDLGETIKSNKTLVPPGAVLISKLNPEISRVWLPKRANFAPQISSTEFLVFKPINPVGRSLLYCLFGSDKFQQTIVGMVTGTSKSHQRVSPKALLELEVLFGLPKLFDAFEETVSSLLEHMLANRAESRTLAQTRDLLLPKLMSGEIRLREAERMVAEADAEARFRVRAQRGQGRTERGLELLRKAAGEDE